jgi:hypothetical protein
MPTNETQRGLDGKLLKLTAFVLEKKLLRWVCKSTRSSRFLLFDSFVEFSPGVIHTGDIQVFILERTEGRFHVRGFAYDL